jgi:hypothetical protein
VAESQESKSDGIATYKYSGLKCMENSIELMNILETSQNYAANNQKRRKSASCKVFIIIKKKWSSNKQEQTCKMKKAY